MLGVATGLGILLYMVSFIYCLFGGKEDLLRTERYSIQKLAIEKGFIGDSISGVIRLKGTDRDRLIGPGQDDTEGDK